MSSPAPTAADGVIAYDGPGEVNVAVAGAPALTNVTDVTESPLLNPEVVNSVPLNVTVLP